MLPMPCIEPFVTYLESPDNEEALQLTEHSVTLWSFVVVVVVFVFVVVVVVVVVVVAVFVVVVVAVFVVVVIAVGSNTV